MLTTLMMIALFALAVPAIGYSAYPARGLGFLPLMLIGIPALYLVSMIFAGGITLLVYAAPVILLIAGIGAIVRAIRNAWTRHQEKKDYYEI